MKLKQLDNYLDFMVSVQSCEGSVTFHSPAGDHLDLRAPLSQYLFAAICGDWNLLQQGRIECTQESDYTKLGAYLVPGN